ncbi:hypothetical protein ABEQ78_10945 [Bacillus altitudinis]|nr:MULTISPECIES: hypothetical protein [Bacillus]MDI6560549.1 hypothetical protein [Bacillus altitudinis]MED0850827.1 hypothetical protein [Bacillus altitudinis]WEZ71601.1 hypothetical protein P5623_01710 [Bacillus altitudinis]
MAKQVETDGLEVEFDDGPEYERLSLELKWNGMRTDHRASLNTP